MQECVDYLRRRFGADVESRTVREEHVELSAAKGTAGVDSGGMRGSTMANRQHARSGRPWPAGFGRRAVAHSLSTPWQELAPTA